MKSFSILFLLLLFGGSLVTAAEIKSSRVTLEIRGKDGEPVRGATVEFRRWQPEGPGTVFLARGTTDEKGQLTQKLALPADYIPAIKATVEREGFFPQSVRFLAVDGAHLRKEIELDREHVTTLQFREKDGRPAAHRLFTSTLGTHFSTAFTDARGEFRFLHRSPERPWMISFRGEPFWIEGKKDAVLKIQPTGLRYQPPGYELMLFSSHPKTTNAPAQSAPPRVRGKLLLEDGSPALGWHIASQIVRGGGWAVMNDPSTIHLDFNYRQLTAVDDTGRFDVLPITNDLLLVSPDGMPFLYPLNPTAWGADNHVKDTTITVPTLTYKNLKLRWDAKDGEPAAGVRLVPRDQGQFYDRWAFGPADSETEQVRAYLGADPPPELSVLRVPVSNDKGEIRIPVHPWLKVTAHSWHAEEKSAPWRTIWLADREDGDVVVLQRNYDSPPNKDAPHAHLRALSCTFQNAQGENVDPQQVHWNLFRKASLTSSGTGGFIAGEDGRHQLMESKWTDRVEFSHENRGTGKREYFTATFEQNKPLRPLEVNFSTVRKHAITGTVMNFKNEPEPGVQLHLTRITNDLNRKYLHLRATCDQEGRFLFSYGPAECDLHLTATWEGNSIRLNHLAEHPKITAENRRIEVVLAPVGAVRVKLLGATTLPTHLILKPQGGDAKNVAPQDVRLHPTQADATVFQAPFVAPGRYSLAFYRDNKIESLSEKPVTIRPDEETKLEVPAAQAMKVAPDAASKGVAVSVTVLRDGKPASGVIVRSEKATANGQGGSGFARGHVANFPGDITDRDGIARFVAPPGSSVFFAAVDQQRHVAWKEVLIRGPNTAVTLDLQPLAKAMPEVPLNRFNNRAAKEVDRAATLLGVYKVAPEN